MQFHRAVPGVMAITVTLLAANCGVAYPTIDTSELQSVRCPGVAVPTKLKVTCHRYPRIDSNLALAVIHADEPTAPPILVIHGGPGGQAIAERHHWLVPRSALLAHHDMILLDQRGSGWSEPSLDCPEVDTPTGSLHDAYRVCRSRLVAEGIDLSHYQLADIVADLTSLRHSTGIDQWILYAISFGTLVAQELLRTDGKGIAATVLDSPLSPRIAAYDELPYEASIAIDKALARCTGGDPCSTGRSERLDDLLRRLATAPTAVSTKSGSTRTIDDVTLAGLILNALSDPKGPSKLPHVVDMAIRGQMAEAVVLFDELGTGGRTTGDSLSEGAQLSAECADVLPQNRTDDQVAGRPLIRAIAGLEAEVRSLCSIWDVPAAPPVRSSDLLSESDVLVLSGHLDPVTPTAWARRVTNDISGAILVESELWGHAASLADRCAAELVTRFLDGYRTGLETPPC